jgi:hypothetical protein
MRLLGRRAMLAGTMFGVALRLGMWLGGAGRYWITSSARRSSEGGNVSPSAEAAFMLMER